MQKEKRVEELKKKGRRREAENGRRVENGYINDTEDERGVVRRGREGEM